MFFSINTFGSFGSFKNKLLSPISSYYWSIFGSTLYNGTNGEIFATVTDYSNNYIYVGGNFTIVYDSSNSAGLAARYVARWDISNNVWNQLGNTLYNGTVGTVNALALDSSRNQLYVGGNFTTVQDLSNTTALSANRIARWDISNNVWRQLGRGTTNGANTLVRSLALDTSRNQLYVGGEFTTVQDLSNTTALSARYVARWDVSNNVWSQLGTTASNGTNSKVNALALDSSNNQLYVGGSFTTAIDQNSKLPQYICSYNYATNVMESISPFGKGGYTNNSVIATVIDYSNNFIYVGGSFTTVYDSSNSAGLAARYVARWDISKNVWNQFGNTTYNGTNGQVNALALDTSRNQLYVGGNFTTVQDLSNTVALSANNIARWDISNNVWRQLGRGTTNGANTLVRSLALDTSRNQLYVGGSFTTVQDLSNTTALSARYVARWDISNNVWRQFGNTTYNGVSNSVFALKLDSSNNQLYVGGSFTTAIDQNSKLSQYICSYNYATNVMESISPFGNGGYTNNSVTASVIDYSNNFIYVGGAFTTVYDSSNPAGLAARYIARWDVSKNVWNQFGNTTYNGTNGQVNALALDSSRNQLYVGGSFTTVQDLSNTGGLAARNVARWDFSKNVWNQFGNTAYNGTNNIVVALALDTSRNQLYVGGQFITVLDTTNTTALSARYVARWDISNNVWRQLGTTASNGANLKVNALALDISRNQLYIGGQFSGVQDSSNTVLLSSVSVARWDISNNVWRQLGSNTYNGTDNGVQALVLDSSRNQLYVGGAFSRVYDSSNTTTMSTVGVARWDISNSVWNRLGSNLYSGTNTVVSALALDTSRNQLYVGGQFTTVFDPSNRTGLFVNRLARWDVSNNVWNRLGNTLFNGINNTVNTMAFNNNNNYVYIGGSFTDTNNILTNSARYVARRDVSNNVWKQFGTTSSNGTDNIVYALELDTSRNQLYVGGEFTTVQDLSNTTALSARYVARWDISSNVWRQFGNTTYNGTSAFVRAFSLDTSNNQLFVGGDFIAVQDTINTTALSAKRVAGWDISNNVWKNLGSGTNNGTNGVAQTLTFNTISNKLYIGGAFTDFTNNNSANYLAKWDISNNVWIKFGNTTYNGANSTVNALALDTSRNQLYVGGQFITVQDTINTTALSAKRVARWDISNNVWRQFGNTTYNGTNNTVNALSLDTSRNQLYVGGLFTTVQDISNTSALSANRIARWNISNN